MKVWIDHSGDIVWNDGSAYSDHDPDALYPYLNRWTHFLRDMYVESGEGWWMILE